MEWMRVLSSVKGFMLQAASKEGNESTIDELLRACANVNAAPTPRNMLTALQAAAKGGHETALTILLKAGAETNNYPAGFGGLRSGFTALSAARVGGNKHVKDNVLKASASLADTPYWPSPYGPGLRRTYGPYVS
jgi:ankyrin repeat protein